MLVLLVSSVMPLCSLCLRIINYTTQFKLDCFYVAYALSFSVDSISVFDCLKQGLLVVTISDGFNVRGAWSEISRGAAVKHFVVAALWYFLRGAALTFFCGGYLNITRHLLESCFTAFLRRAAFTAYFEAAFFAAFFRGSCFVAFFGGGCFAAFFRGGCFATFWRGPGATTPLAPHKNHHWLRCTVHRVRGNFTIPVYDTFMKYVNVI